MKNGIDISILRGPQFYSFSDCYLDTVERRLFKKYKRLDVTPRALEVLQVLIENAGQVVSKDELLHQIWGESFVEESNLAVQISKLRTALGASKREPYIVTESGVGYRFVSKVKMVNDDEWSDIIENELSIREDGKQQFTSIAVMPLLNENGDEEIQYLADGITESLINTLSQNQELRVVARNTVFQFKDKEIDLKNLGRRLRVATLLTGRVRLVQEYIVIAVELSKVADGSHIWGTQKNEPIDDIFQIQERISKRICDELQLRINKLNNPNREAESEHDFESYCLNLKGRYFVRKSGADNLPKAIDCFQQALSINPMNHDAYVDLANCHILMHLYDLTTFYEARTEASKLLKQASALSQESSKVLWLKGVIALDLEWNLLEAGKLFQQALDKDPNSGTCNSSYANLLAHVEMFSEAMSVAKRLLRLDPISAKNKISAARILYRSEQFASSLVLLKEASELDPVSYDNAILQAANYIELNDFDLTLEQIERARRIYNGFELFALEGYSYGKAGRVKEANDLIHKLTKLAKTAPVPHVYFAYIYAGLNDVEKAFARISESIDCHEINILSLRSTPMFANLRSDRRYDVTIKQIGLDIQL